MFVHKLSFAADHAGFEMKQSLIKYAEELGYQTIDHGTHTADPVDYPDFVPPVTQDILSGQADFGILICGSGIGMDIAANRIPQIRAALCHTPSLAEMSRKHNDANVLCLGSRFIELHIAQACLKVFVRTPFESKERHQRRVEKLGYPYC